MAIYEALDYYSLQEHLKKEEIEIRDKVREFVSVEIMPVICKHHRDGTFPMHLIPRFGELGLLGASIKGYGCPGRSGMSYGLICQELERGDTGIRSFCSVQSSLVMYPIWTFGSEEQKEKYLPGMATGRYIGCFGLTEPDFGSNPSGMLSKATRVNGGYKLNGTKRWITNGSIAHVALIWAKLDNRVHGFLVPTDTPGFHARDINGKWSMRASVTSELIMDDCIVGDNALLPGVSGLRGVLACLTQARFGVAFGALGVMISCYQEAIDYTRRNASKVARQLIQDKLVRMVNEITKSQLLCLRLGQLKDSGELRSQQVSLAKRNNVYWAREIARDARELLCVDGVTQDSQCGRHMRNIESVYTYEGTHNMHTLIVGQDVTGISAFHN